MVDTKRFKLPDIYPLCIQFINEDWEPLEVDYVCIMADDQETKSKKTTGKGFVLASDLKIGGKIKLIQSEVETEEKQKIQGEYSNEHDEYPENPGPLPVLDLRDRSKGGKGPLRRNDSRRSLVEHLQSMLNYLGYDLGTSGTEEDGVDGIFQNKTQAAIEEFQESHRDWNRKILKIDGIVGARTADALNRELVGLWYPRYETPEQLTSGHKIITMTEEFAKKEGLIIGR